jgi:hypothetical protein
MIKILPFNFCGCSPSWAGNIQWFREKFFAWYGIQRLIFHALRSQPLTACILHTESYPFFKYWDYAVLKLTWKHYKRWMDEWMMKLLWHIWMKCYTSCLEGLRETVKKLCLCIIRLKPDSFWESTYLCIDRCVRHVSLWYMS